MRELLDSKFASSAVQQNHKIEGLKRCDQDGLGILSEEVKISLTDLESVEASCFAPDGVRTTVAMLCAEIHATFLLCPWLRNSVCSPLVLSFSSLPLNCCSGVGSHKLLVVYTES